MSDPPVLYAVAKLADLDPVPCPCGTTRRAFVDDPDRLASMHLLQISADSQVHYHQRLTEVYYLLGGAGHLELDGAEVPVEPGLAVLIKPGCRHRAVGELQVLVMALPAFDPADEWFD